MFRGDFWRTLPGMITAAAGLISALTALVAAINGTGLTARFRGEAKVAVESSAKPGADGKTAAAASLDPAAVNGT